MASGSSVGQPGGGDIPLEEAKACRWPRARAPLKVTSKPDWVRSQFSTSDWSHREVSVGDWSGRETGMSGQAVRSKRGR